MTEKSLIKGAAVLAAAGIIVKVIGAVFRIVVAGIITDTGMAYYSPAYNLYAVLLVVSTSGIPIAISRMVSERYAIGRYDEADRVFHISRYLMIGLGLAGALVLFIIAKPFAAAIDLEGSAMAMQAMAPALLLVPIMSSYRGYFQGQQLMGPTALSQVVEQIFRVGFGILLALLLMQGTFMASVYTDPLQRGAAGVCFGASTGAAGGLAVMLIIYLRSRSRIRRQVAESKGEGREPAGAILKAMLAIAVPITIGATLMPLVNLVDATVVNRRLLESGFDAATAKALYGQLTGFCEPIIALPQVLMSAIVISIVPMVAAANKLKDTEKLHETISLGLRMATILAFPCAAGLLILAKPALMMIFFTQKEAAANAAPSLQVLGLSFILLALITIMTGILQGVGRQVYPVINLFLGLLVKVVVTWILVALPAVNVVGAPIGTMTAYIVAMTLDLICVLRFTGARFRFSQLVVKPMISSVVMGVVVFATYKGAFMLLGSNTLATLLAIAVGVVVYGVMIFKTRTILREEMLEIAAGRKLVAVADRLKLW